MLDDKTLWTATSSSTLNGHPLSFGIDGIVAENFAFFSSDYHDSLPWYQAELDASYLVMQVDVYNRRDNSVAAHAFDFEYIQVKDASFFT